MGDGINLIAKENVERVCIINFSKFTQMAQRTYKLEEQELNFSFQNLRLGRVEE